MWQRHKIQLVNFDMTSLGVISFRLDPLLGCRHIEMHNPPAQKNKRAFLRGDALRFDRLMVPQNSRCSWSAQFYSRSHSRSCSVLIRPVIYVMKYTLKLLLTVIVTALACFLVPSSGSAADSGQLTVKRSPNFGAKTGLYVFVDGKRVRSLARGESYTTSLPVGTHQVKVQASLRKLRNEAAAQVTVEAGKAYRLTASWEGEQLVLK
jgi:hypothetical protein